MPIYLTDRVTEFDIEHNDNAYFVYFDSLKKDNNVITTLMLRDKDNGIPIIYRTNMSDSGNWLKDYNNNIHAIDYIKEINKCTSSINKIIAENKLLVFPMHSFNVVLHSMDKEIADIYINRLEQVIKNSSLKKDFVSHALSFKL